MKVFIARTAEQARKYTEAMHARHVVVLEGSNEPTGGFGRPPAQPTLGYARLHFATPVARFEGIAVGVGDLTGHGQTQVELCQELDEVGSELRRKVHVGSLPCVLTLAKREQATLVGGVAQWEVARVDYLHGVQEVPAATPSKEGVDVGPLHEQDHADQAHRPRRGAFRSRSDAFAGTAASEGEPSGSEGDGGE